MTLRNATASLMVTLGMLAWSVCAMAAPGPATSQPADEPEAAPDAPLVTKVGPAATVERPRDNEIKASTTRPDKAADATPPPVPTPEDVAMWLGAAGEYESKPGSPEDVSGRLSDKPPVQAVRPGPPNKEGTSVPVDTLRAEASKLLPDGFVIVDRLGHVVRDRGRWMFVFDADKANVDPPLTLLPNTPLELMLNQSNFGRANVRFRVSGEVTQYQQTNYLILRKVLIEHNMDRFVN